MRLLILELTCTLIQSGGSCEDDEDDLAYAINLNDKCTIFKKGMHYCCRKKLAPLGECHWGATGDERNPFVVLRQKYPRSLATPPLDYSVDESADDTDPNDLTKRDLEGLYGNPWNAEQGKEPNTNFDSSTISTLPQAGSCAATNIEVVDRNTLTRRELIDGWDTEHNPDFKGRIFNIKQNPQDINAFNKNLEKAVETGTGEAELLNPLKQVISVFKYINERRANTILHSNRQGLLDASETLSNEIPELVAFHAIHNEFDTDWYEARTQLARNWVPNRILDIIIAYNIAENNGHILANAQSVLLEMDLMFAQLSGIKPPLGSNDD
ncbi:hypothetical protein ACEPPN_000563 [Leptodophora sp. 'Broadleaf-Isolate-01']